MLNIALVEDDDKAADTLSKFLDAFSNTHGAQFKITRFTDPTILLDDYKPVWDIVFMDIEMPNMNGMDAAYSLRRLDQKAVLIFVTNMRSSLQKATKLMLLTTLLSRTYTQILSVKCNALLQYVQKPTIPLLLLSAAAVCVCV